MRANCTNRRLPPHCRWKPIVLLVRHSHDWQSEMGISHSPANFGKHAGTNRTRSTLLVIW